MVEAGRVVGVEEGGGVADERPALAHVLLRHVGQVRVEAEVVAPHLGALEQLLAGGELLQELEVGGLLVALLGEIEQAAVEDDADRGLAVAERDEPGPGAAPHVVIGREAARREVAPREGDRTARGQVVDRLDVLSSAPRWRRSGARRSSRSGRGGGRGMWRGRWRRSTSDSGPWRSRRPLRASLRGRTCRARRRARAPGAAARRRRRPLRRGCAGRACRAGAGTRARRSSRSRRSRSPRGGGRPGRWRTSSAGPPSAAARARGGARGRGGGS